MNFGMIGVSEPGQSQFQWAPDMASPSQTTLGFTAQPTLSPAYLIVQGSTKSPGDNDRTLTVKVEAWDPTGATSYGSGEMSIYAHYSGTHYALPMAFIPLKNTDGTNLPKGASIKVTIANGNSNSILEGNDFWSITVAELDQASTA